MKIKLDKEYIEQWLEKRSQRETVLILLAGFVLIYIFWDLFFSLPLRHEREKLQDQRQNLAQLIEKQKQHLSTIESVIASASFSRSLEKQQTLNAQFHQAEEELKSIQQTVIPEAALVQVTNSIIAQPIEVSLVSMKTFPNERWLKTPEANESLSPLQGVYQQKMELEFRGNYFDAITFFGHLEKLPWHLYWDYLDYQVLSYPEAKIVAGFYLLNKK